MVMLRRNILFVYGFWDGLCIYVGMFFKCHSHCNCIFLYLLQINIFIVSIDNVSVVGQKKISIKNIKNYAGICYYVSDMVVLMKDENFVEQFNDVGKKTFKENLEKTKRLFLDRIDFFSNYVFLNNTLPNGQMYCANVDKYTLGRMIDDMFKYENTIFAWMRRFINWYFGNAEIIKKYNDNDRSIILSIIISRISYLSNNCYVNGYHTGKDNKGSPMIVLGYSNVVNHGYSTLRCFLFDIIMNYGLQDKDDILYCDMCNIAFDSSTGKSNVIVDFENFNIADISDASIESLEIEKNNQGKKIIQRTISKLI